MGVLETHVWGSTVKKLERPDRLVFDLDPDPHVAWTEVIDAARAVRLVLEELGLQTFLKTTGGKGLHIVVPITPRTNWDDAKGFSQAVADFIVRARAGPLYCHDEQEGTTRQGFHRLFAQWPGRNRSSPLLDACPPGRTREHADRLGRVVATAAIGPL